MSKGTFKLNSVAVTLLTHLPLGNIHLIVQCSPFDGNGVSMVTTNKIWFQDFQMEKNRACGSGKQSRLIYSLV